MYKWLWLGLIVVPVVLLSGCAGSDDTLNPGEGTGSIETGDFNPFDGARGPLNMHYFTAPKAATYQIILSSGPDSPPLRSPWVMVFVGHVDETNESFFGAYDGGAGVLKQTHGSNIAQLTIKARAGREYTVCFGSWDGGTGNYSWSVAKL